MVIVVFGEMKYQSIKRAIVKNVADNQEIYLIYLKLFCRGAN